MLRISERVENATINGDNVTISIACDGVRYYELMCYGVKKDILVPEGGIELDENRDYLSFIENDYLSPSYNDPISKGITKIWEISESLYFKILNAGGDRDEAVRILPFSVKHLVVFTATIDEWFELLADPDFITTLKIPLYSQVKKAINSVLGGVDA